MSASGSVKSGYTPVEVHIGAHLDGEAVHHHTASGRSSSPVSNMSLSGDEVGPGISNAMPGRRSARRNARFTTDRDNTSLTSIDHVRFDDHVSYIDSTLSNDERILTRSVEDFAN